MLLQLGRTNRLHGILSGGAIEALIARRRAVLDLLENAVEGREAGEACLHGNLGDRDCRIEQEHFRRARPPQIDVLEIGHRIELFEDTGKMEFAVACDLSEGIQ